jgi:hypothetical protein
MTSLNHRIQGTQIEVQTKEFPVGTMHYGLEAEIAEVTHDFILGHDLTQCKFKTQLQEVEARVAHGVNGSTKVDSDRVEYTEVQCVDILAMFCCQFEAMAGHCKWACCIKVTQLLAALQGWASNILHRVLQELTFKETIKDLEERFVECYLAAMYRNQLKKRTQCMGEPLQEFATTVEQLTQVLGNSIRDRGITHQLFLGGRKTLNEALRQTLRLQKQGTERCGGAGTIPNERRNGDTPIGY